MICRNESSAVYRDWNPDPSFVQPITTPYTDYATPALIPGREN
jgi:hypothetical protein